MGAIQKLIAKISSTLKVNFWAIMSAIIAIGAYSGDSIIVKLFKNNDRFSVSQSLPPIATTLQKTPFYRLYHTPLGSQLAPIQTLIPLNIRNNTNVDQNISAIKVDIEDEYNNWNTAVCLAKKEGVYFVNNGLEKATLLNFDKLLLIESLQETIKPQVVVRGWLLLELPKKFWLIEPKSNRFRITLFTGFGEKEDHIISNIDYNFSTATEKSSFPISKETNIDISCYNISPVQSFYENLGVQVPNIDP